MGSYTPPHGYTAEELEHATGFDRRTIAYYVQEGLLPNVGKRGPRTRYPKLFRDRLLFIRRMRDAEAAGESPPVSLGDLREIFERVPSEMVSKVADGHIDAHLFSTASSGYHRPKGTDEWMDVSYPGSAPGHDKVSEPPFWERGFEESHPVPDSEYHEAMELGDSLADLQEVARRRHKLSSRLTDTWSRIEISSEIALSVRGVTDEDAGLLERVRQGLQRLIFHRSKGRR